MSKIYIKKGENFLFRYRWWYTNELFIYIHICISIKPFVNVYFFVTVSLVCYFMVLIPHETHLLCFCYIYIFYIYVHTYTYICVYSLFYSYFQIPIAFSGHGSHTLNMGVYASTIQQNDYCHLENLTEAINFKQ